MCNGTILIVTELRIPTVEAQALTGTEKKKVEVVIRMAVAPSETVLPLISKRRPFPVKKAYPKTKTK